MAEQEKKSKGGRTGQDVSVVGKLDDKLSTKVYVDVHFVCQQCSQPLKLDQSLSSAYLEEKLGELKARQDKLPDIEQSPPYPTDPQEEDRMDKRKEWALNTQRSIETDCSDSSTLDFVTHSKQSDEEAKRARLRLAEQYFNALSSTSPVDHPLCTECIKFCLRQLENDVLFSEEAKYQYEGLLKEWEKEYESEEGKLKDRQLEEEVAKLKREEEEIQEQLADIVSQRSSVKNELALTLENLEGLKSEDKDLHRRYNIHQGEMFRLQDEVRSVEYQTTHASEQLKSLRKTNVLGMAFRIWHQGLFGTINGFRLGRLTTVPVEWGEINAAWGQCTLLLTCLTRYAGITFQKFSVVPYGNQSYVLQYPEREGKQSTSLPLHTSGGYKFMIDSKFDRAMVAYLECFAQLKQHIEGTGKCYKLPYAIERDRIGDSGKVYSIKMQGNSPEHWTKALKFLLTNLQWAITWQQMNSVK